MDGFTARIRAELRRQRHEAIDAYRAQPRAGRLLARLCRHCDRALRQLVQHFPLPAHAALVAVGGYGRGELYPESDVDLVIVLSGEPDTNDVQRIERLLAAMWDVGLQPSHSVRSVPQCLELATQDVTIQTALLEARWLAGSRTLVHELASQLRQELDPAAFFLAKRNEMRRRHAHFHDTPYALEPNCKESPGALRDLHLLLWLAHAAGYGASWADVMRAGALTDAEYRSLRRAENAFKRLRVELHLLTGRREDRLRFDLQPALAEIYGFEAGEPPRASELLMQRYYWAARVVSQLTTILLQAIEERLFAAPGDPIRLDDDFNILHGRLDLRRDDALERNPALIFMAFLHLQQHGELNGMTARSLRALWHARKRIDSQFRRNPVNRQRFLRILMQPQRVAQALYLMTMLNVLPRYLPVFRRIVGQMQHDLFHAYTVDEHTLKVVRMLRRYALPEYAHEYPLATQLMADFDKPWLLYIAALFHDIAKGRGGDHSELGAAYVLRFCRQHRLAKEDTALVVFLVRHHLLLSMVAQKRDLSDPRVIHDLARHMETEERLRALYLLTVADIRATSPVVWNTWKGKLMDDLYQRTRIALGGGRPDTRAVLAQRAERAKADIRTLGVSDEQRDALWQVLDIAYFLRHEASEIAWHTEQLATRLHDPGPVVRARVAGANEALQVMVYAVDRKDLFASICQYFEGHTLSVQEARIHTTLHGWALDSFIVLFAGHEANYADHIGPVQRELTAHLERGAALDTAASSVCRLPAAARRQVQTFPLAPRIELQADEHSASWRLLVVCPDRPGLLYALACTFAAHQINLKMAKIHTLGKRAEDVFILEGDTLLQRHTRLLFEHALLDVLKRA